MTTDAYCTQCDLRQLDFDAHIKVFHELMRHKVRDILLVSAPYDAFILEEDGSLTSKIINEYKGLNLSHPPLITKAFSGKEALALLDRRSFDLVITMPNLEDMDTVDLVMKVKGKIPDLPVLLLSHRSLEEGSGDDETTCAMIDNEYVWTGNSELLLALIKGVEDATNVDNDTKKGMVRVLILVEDSPLYRSLFLPLIYKVVVRQTLSLLDESINAEHRVLKMRARPKILVAENYETAMAMFEQFRPYVFCVMSDTRFPMGCVATEDAGFHLLSHIKAKIPHLPLLLMSSESKNRDLADQIEAVFIDKNSPHLQKEIEQFFIEYLGFGDFIFRLPDHSEVGRAADLQGLEKLLPQIPDEPIEYHGRRNHFSNWLMARSEIALASKFAEIDVSDFDSIRKARQFIIDAIHELRKSRQRGMVVQFPGKSFDPNIADFVKMGKGSLGGKARGLAFMSNLLYQHTDLSKKYGNIQIEIPQTLVIATDGFESFIEQNKLAYSRFCSCDDEEIRRRFLSADIPEQLFQSLEEYLSKVNGPLSVRSSSLLEDAYFQSYAGLYETFMIPNDHPDFFVRLHHLITAVKLVYASTYYEKAKVFSQQISRQFHEDSMAVIIQQLAGSVHGEHFYPAISGAAQSYNFYPVAHMRPEDGICQMALGFGSILEEAERVLRWSPRHPTLMPQFSTVDDILANAQRHFYAIKMGTPHEDFDPATVSCLEKREIADAETEFPVRQLSGTYIPEEHRIRDSGYLPGPKVMTFATLLKYKTIPITDILIDLLEIGRKGMGGAVEIEFAVDLAEDKNENNKLYFLQLRPMSAEEAFQDIQIGPEDVKRAFCYSTHTLGHGKNSSMADIVYVKSADFDAAATRDIAAEIGKLNAALKADDKPYLLAGPGRWGSADHWLGIPVSWPDISGVGAMIEVRDGRLNADASQGSHFFQKLTSRDIHYITLERGVADRFDWGWVDGLPAVKETRHLRHVRLDKPFVLINDGKSSQCVMIA
jgi:CheY-like chemotaxis protein